MWDKMLTTLKTLFNWVFGSQWLLIRGACMALFFGVIAWFRKPAETLLGEISTLFPNIQSKFQPYVPHMAAANYYFPIYEGLTLLFSLWSIYMLMFALKFGRWLLGWR